MTTTPTAATRGIIPRIIQGSRSRIRVSRSRIRDSNIQEEIERFTDLGINIQDYQCCCGVSVIRATYFLGYMHLAMAFTIFLLGVLLADNPGVIGTSIPLAMVIGMCASLSLFGQKMKNPLFLKPLLMLLIFEALLSSAGAIWTSVDLFDAIEALDRLHKYNDLQYDLPTHNDTNSDSSRKKNEEIIAGDVTLIVMMIGLVLLFCWFSVTVHKAAKYWYHYQALRLLPVMMSDARQLELSWSRLQEHAGYVLPPPPPPYCHNEAIILTPRQFNAPGNPPPHYDNTEDTPPDYDQLNVQIEAPSTSNTTGDKCTADHPIRIDK